MARHDPPGDQGIPGRQPAAPLAAQALEALGRGLPAASGGELSQTAELWRTLARLVEPPDAVFGPLAASLGLPAPPPAHVHLEVFSRQLYPYASVHLGPEGAMGGEARERAAGFWRAIGLTPPPEPDHLVTMLAFHGGIVEQSLAGGAELARERWLHARRVHFWEHLASWLFCYLDRLEAQGGDFYRAWARLARRLLASEAQALGPPATCPVAIAEMERSALDHDLSAAGEGGQRREVFIAALLATVRAGAMTSRSDLSRLAAETDLAPRQGDRALILGSFLDQDARATLAWLAREMAARSRSYSRWPPEAEAISRLWRRRARATAERLRRLAG